MTPFKLLSLVAILPMVSCQPTHNTQTFTTGPAIGQNSNSGGINNGPFHSAPGQTVSPTVDVKLDPAVLPKP